MIPEDKLKPIKEYIIDKVCTCDICSGYYCGHYEVASNIIEQLLDIKRELK